MLKRSECSKLAKAKFKQAAQGRAEPSHEETTRLIVALHRLLLSFEMLSYSLLLMLLLLMILLLLLMLLIAGAADV